MYIEGGDLIMSDDDKTKTDKPVSDSADEVKEEPAAEVETETAEETKEETEEKPAEEAAAEEPKADEAASDAPAPTAEPAGTDQQGRTLYSVKCTNCGKDTQVPFEPSGGRPVYCRDCYMQKKNA